MDGGRRQIGPYVVGEELARGGQGVVFRAQGPEGPVALKLLLDVDPVAQLRFRQEAAVLLRTAHPNVLQAHELGESNGRQYLVTELIDGEDLDRRVGHAGPPEAGVARSWVRQVAEGLEHCHQLGLVHRDLKPANVIVERGTERLVIIDYGLVARDPAEFGELSIDDFSRLSETGEILGTPAYMAPEQADAAFGKVGPRTDVYALGGLLFFLLTGRAPYTGTTIYAVFEQLLDGTRPSPDPRSHVPGAPADLVALCRACLAKDPATRPPSAAAVVRALSRPAHVGQEGRWRLWAGVAGLLLVGGAGIGGASLASWGKQEPPVPAESPSGDQEPPSPTSADPTAPAPSATAFKDLLERGHEEHGAGRKKAARALFREALEVRPAGTAADSERAFAFASVGMLQEALAEAQRVLDADPGHAEALWVRGDVRRQLGDSKGAMEDFDAAVSKQPGLARAWVSRGELHFDAKRYEAAIEDLEKAVELRFSSYPVLAKLAVSYAATGAGLLAEGALEGMERAYSDQAERTNLIRAGIYQDCGELERSLAVLDRLLSEIPDHAVALRRRTSVRLLLDDLTGALEDAQRYAKSTKSEVNVAELWGRCYLFLGEIEKADDEFFKILDSEPTHKTAERVLLRRVMALRLSGRLETALAMAKEAHLALPSSLWGPLWFAAQGGSTSLLEPLLEEEEPWLQALAEALGEADFGEVQRVVATCPSPRERSIALSMLGVRAETLGEQDLALKLYRQCLEAGGAGTLTYEWAKLRLNQER